MLSDPFFLAIGAGCIVVALILATGIAQMGRGGVENAKRSNKFMQARIIAQLVVVLALVAYVTFRGTGG